MFHPKTEIFERTTRSKFIVFTQVLPKGLHYAQKKNKDALFSKFRARRKTLNCHCFSIRSDPFRSEVSLNINRISNDDIDGIIRGK